MTDPAIPMPHGAVHIDSSAHVTCKTGCVTTHDWEDRVAALWGRMDEMEPAPFVAAMQEVAAELPAGDPRAAFELGAANDLTGHPDLAVGLYRQALAGGLDGIRRRRATIQLASSLRNLGHAEESVELLRAARDQPPDELADAVLGFLALALTDIGREREAVALALEALAPHLVRYNRSLAAYATALLHDAE